MTKPNQAERIADLAAREFEFDSEHNSVIRETASMASAWGIISIILGIGGMATALLALVENTLSWAYLPVGLANLVVGIVFIGVSNSLRRIVETEGNDIKHMMAAMVRLTTAFIIQIVVIALGYAISLTLGLFGV